MAFKIKNYTDGEVLSASDLNNQNSVFATNIINSAPTGSIYQGVKVATLVAGSSNAYAIGTSYHCIGSTFDDFLDGVISPTKYTAVKGGDNVTGSTYSEAGGSARWYVTGTGVSNGNANDSITVTIERSFDITGSPAIFYCDFDATGYDGGGDSLRGVNEYAAFIFGNTNLAAISVDTHGAGAAQITGQYYVVLNALRTSAEVYKNGVSQGGISLASNAGSKFSLTASAGRYNASGTWSEVVIRSLKMLGSPTETAVGSLVFYEGTALNGSINNFIGVVDQTLRTGTTGSNYVSFDNGSTYTQFTSGDWTKVNTTNNYLRSKVVYNVPMGGSFNLNRFGYMYS